MTAWVALVRGVNVGGVRLSMPAFRESIESLGYGDVGTYVQSGNAVFTAEDDEPMIVERIEAVLRERHELAVPVVARCGAEMAGMADRHPFSSAGLDPKLLHVAFLDREPNPTGEPTLDRWLPDRWALDGRELFLAYPNGSGRSKMTIDRFERPWGVTATARNLNTVAKLAALAAELDAGGG